MSKRRTLVSANWKMNGSLDSIRQLVRAISQGMTQETEPEVIICPPSVYISELAEILKKTDIGLGAQNVSHLECGAHTGEVAPTMLKDFACKYVIVGHSERRIFFQETNADIALKLDLISESSLIPILCIGESVDEKNQNKTEIILEQQLIESLSAGSKLQNLIIAYEPVWAIGSGSSAAPEEINSIHKLIKDIVQSRFSALDLQGVIYGGSVNIENAFPILEEEEVDGALIGGASLNGEEFAKIANILNELKEL